jgi:hypothetical protein
MAASAKIARSVVIRSTDGSNSELRNGRASPLLKILCKTISQGLLKPRKQFIATGRINLQILPSAPTHYKLQKQLHDIKNHPELPPISARILFRILPVPIRLIVEISCQHIFKDVGVNDLKQKLLYKFFL